MPNRMSERSMKHTEQVLKGAIGVIVPRSHMTTCATRRPTTTPPGLTADAYGVAALEEGSPPRSMISGLLAFAAAVIVRLVGPRGESVVHDKEMRPSDRIRDTVCPARCVIRPPGKWSPSGSPHFPCALKRPPLLKR